MLAYQTLTLIVIKELHICTHSNSDKNTTSNIQGLHYVFSWLTLTSHGSDEGSQRLQNHLEVCESIWVNELKSCMLDLPSWSGPFKGLQQYQ